MIILKMRASFGKLHGELTLHEGMNLLCLPNEAGKSTWSAFLLAMLYGIDTTERTSKANEGLPAKERYRPWDGSPMEGSMDLLWNGRKLTIERTGTARAPMGSFRAYETDGGAAVPELTAENCGRVLCGVERSVFERTAFIRQLGLSVTRDDALEKRLGALVTTGEDGAKSFSELKDALKDRRNKLVGRVGRLPQLTEREAYLTRGLQELETLRGDVLAIESDLAQAKQAQAEADALLQRYERAQAAQKRAGLEALEQELAIQQQRCERLAETTAALPPRETLSTLQRQLDAAQNALQTAQMEAAFAPKGVEKPTAPACFTAMSAEQAVTRAEKDTADYAALTDSRPKSLRLPLLLSALVLALGIAAFFLLSLPIAAALTALGAVGVAVTLLLRLRSAAGQREAQHKAELLLLRYSVSDAAEILPLAQKYQAQMQVYETEAEALRQQKAAAAEVLAQKQTQADRLLAEVRHFAPKADSSAACREAIAAALQAHDRLLTEQRALAQQTQQLSSMQQLFGKTQVSAPDAEALAFDEAKLNYEKTTAERRVQSLSVQLAQKQGMIIAKGEPAALQEQLDETREQLAAVQQKVQATDLCLAALTAADAALRARFSPQITQEAARLLDVLTDGKYRKLLLNPDMRLSVSEEQGVVLRPAAAMSCGTADQMYLALRLAMSRRLLPPDAPILLDDALVNFDEVRAAAAIRLLQNEAAQRQVILFTCRRLEA